MIEEEARLVHKHVRLAGRIARLEEKILTLLSTKSRRVFDANGLLVYCLCPVCRKTFVSLQTLRNHLRSEHYQMDSADIGSKSVAAGPPWTPLSAVDTSGDEHEAGGDDPGGYTEGGTTLTRDNGAKYNLFRGDIEYDSSNSNGLDVDSENDSSLD